VLAELLEHYGRDLHRDHGEFKILAICHDDTRMSCTIDLENDRWYCFACNKGGGPIQLIMHMEGLDYADADQYAKRILGDSYQHVQHSSGGERDSVSLFGGARNKRRRGPYVPSWRRG